ncbi:MAG: hypothetical protein ABI591_33585 [Kofleriaceae bacterium]
MFVGERDRLAFGSKKKGIIDGVVVRFFDITGQAKAETALAAREEVALS